MKINIYGDGASIYGNETSCQRVCIYKREIREEEEIKFFRSHGRRVLAS